MLGHREAALVPATSYSHEHHSEGNDEYEITSPAASEFCHRQLQKGLMPARDACVRRRCKHLSDARVNTLSPEPMQLYHALT
ncbi:hypothetical protein AXF42_Ash008009 [Apostasia shenzhenica]|uniref:Uncharacterized protein n=1 Tax=Apostasia shenzhenica TaxID=1088818 RepID=A0A2I0A891_9ASPA|nr:hypothetical protein AXF42_Ash008009 [Apostasia shenzhenica]